MAQDMFSDEAVSALNDYVQTATDRQAAYHKLYAQPLAVVLAVADLNFVDTFGSKARIISRIIDAR